MCKKFIAMGVLGLAGAVTVAGTGAWSYVKTGVHHASDSVRNSVPVEWELNRARQMISELEPEIERNMQKVIKEGVEVRKLAEQIDAKQDQLAKSQDEIKTLTSDLQSGSIRFVYNRKTYSADQVQEDLERRFKQHKAHQATTNKLVQILSAREKNLAAAKAHVDELLAAKSQLEVQVEDLQARLTLVDVAQASSQVVIDDTLLSDTRALIDDIGTRIEVKEQMVASAGGLEGSIKLDQQTSPELLEEIAQYFGDDQAEVETLLSSNEL